METGARVLPAEVLLPLILSVVLVVNDYKQIATTIELNTLNNKTRIVFKTRKEFIMKKNYIIVLTAEVVMESITAVNNYINNGWYMIDYTPNRIVLEKQFEFEGNKEALKSYVEHTGGLVSAVYVGIDPIYFDNKGWLDE